MLQNKLVEIKGRLLEMMFEMYRDMNTDETGIDYAEFYSEIQSYAVRPAHINMTRRLLTLWRTRK